MPFWYRLLLSAMLLTCISGFGRAQETPDAQPDIQSEFNPDVPDPLDPSGGRTIGGDVHDLYKKYSEKSDEFFTESYRELRRDKKPAEKTDGYQKLAALWHDLDVFLGQIRGIQSERINDIAGGKSPLADAIRKARANIPDPAERAKAIGQLIQAAGAAGGDAALQELIERTIQLMRWVDWISRAQSLLHEALEWLEEASALYDQGSILTPASPSGNCSFPGQSGCAALPGRFTPVTAKAANDSGAHCTFGTGVPFSVVFIPINELGNPSFPTFNIGDTPGAAGPRPADDRPANAGSTPPATSGDKPVAPTAPPIGPNRRASSAADLALEKLDQEVKDAERDVANARYEVAGAIHQGLGLDEEADRPYHDAMHRLWMAKHELATLKRQRYEVLEESFFSKIGQSIEAARRQMYPIHLAPDMGERPRRKDAAASTPSAGPGATGQPPEVKTGDAPPAPTPGDKASGGGPSAGDPTVPSSGTTPPSPPAGATEAGGTSTPAAGSQPPRETLMDRPERAVREAWDRLKEAELLERERSTRRGPRAADRAATEKAKKEYEDELALLNDMRRITNAGEPAPYGYSGKVTFPPKELLPSTAPPFDKRLLEGALVPLPETAPPAGNSAPPSDKPGPKERADGSLKSASQSDEPSGTIRIVFKASDEAIEAGSRVSSIKSGSLKLTTSKDQPLPTTDTVTKTALDTGSDADPVTCRYGKDGECTVHLAAKDAPNFGFPPISSRNYSASLPFHNNNGVVIQEKTSAGGAAASRENLPEAPAGVLVTTSNFSIGNQGFTRVSMVGADAIAAEYIAKLRQKLGDRVQIDWCIIYEPGPQLGAEPISYSAIHADLPNATIKLRGLASGARPR